MSTRIRTSVRPSSSGLPSSWWCWCPGAERQRDHVSDRGSRLQLWRDYFGLFHLQLPDADPDVFPGLPEVLGSSDARISVYDHRSSQRDGRTSAPCLRRHQSTLNEAPVRALLSQVQDLKVQKRFLKMDNYCQHYISLSLSLFLCPFEFASVKTSENNHNY